MSANPVSPMPSGWESIIKAATNAHLASLGLTPDKLQAIGNGIAPQEAMALPVFVPVKRRHTTVIEDAELKLGSGYAVYTSVAVDATFIKPTKGHAPKGERPIEPDDPGGWVVDAVWLVRRDSEVDITDILDGEGLVEIADYLAENVEPE